MRILRVHNRYLQRGGEDAVFEAEVQLLRDHGHDVETVEVSNEAIAQSQSPLAPLKLATTTVWSRQGRRLVADTSRRHRAEVVHFDNTFPLISPAAYSAARATGAAIVQTLHNYRLLCPNALLFRDGRPCEDCLGKVPLPGVIHGCYRNSRPQTAVVATMLSAHRILHTWSSNVDRFIALTEFAKCKFVQGGLQPHKINVKPNAVESLDVPAEPRESHLLFTGRLSPEKGIDILMQIDYPVPLRLAGDGPLGSTVRAWADTRRDVAMLGLLPASEVRRQMATARALLVPSICYETFGNVAVEAFSVGLPVIASRIGAFAEVVRDEVTGLLFSPGDPNDLAEKVRWAVDHPDEIRRMGDNARLEYEEKYTPERSYQQLMDIYEKAITHRRING